MLPRRSSSVVFTLPMIMLVTSATASRTSSQMAGYSVINIALAILHARPAVHDTLPVPTHGPASPIKDTTPEAGAASVFSVNDWPGFSTTPSIVENTSLDALVIASQRSAEVTVGAGSCSVLIDSSRSHSLRLKQPGQFFLDLIRGEWLAHIAGCAALHCLKHFGLRPFRTHHQNRQVFPGRLCPDFGQELQPVHVGHVDVGQDQADGLFFQSRQTLHPVICLIHGPQWHLRLH